MTITSLRAGTRAHAIRRARRCYDHMGGRLAVAITAALIRDGHLAGHDGSIDPDRRPGPRPAGGVLDPIVYTLTDDGATFLHDKLGVPTQAHTAVQELPSRPRGTSRRAPKRQRTDEGGGGTSRN